jgi:hypothetical protein
MLLAHVDEREAVLRVQLDDLVGVVASPGRKRASLVITKPTHKCMRYDGPKLGASCIECTPGAEIAPSPPAHPPPTALPPQLILPTPPASAPAFPPDIPSASGGDLIVSALSSQSWDLISDFSARSHCSI